MSDPHQEDPQREANAKYLSGPTLMPLKARAWNVPTHIFYLNMPALSKNKMGCKKWIVYCKALGISVPNV